MTESYFPSVEHREALAQRLKAAKWDYAILTEFERFQWHAYDHAWRRVLGHARLGGFDKNCEWWNEAMIAQAEQVWRKKFGRPAERVFKRPSSEDSIRTNLGEIPWTQMTHAEQDLMRPRFLEMCEGLKSVIAASAARMRRGMAAPRRYGEPAHETAARAHRMAQSLDDRARVLTERGLKSDQRQEELPPL